MGRDGDAGVQCLSPLPDSRARIRFSGVFQGREVLWDMRLYTLRRYAQEHPGQEPGTLRAFIDIAPDEDGQYRLEVGLDVPVIDEPTVRKAVLMIRNYRRLRLGRHEWGEPVPPP
ncbi:MAG: hypothetical protein WCC36_02315 [Gammaproteobacteria bacterium]